MNWVDTELLHTDAMVRLRIGPIVMDGRGLHDAVLARQRELGAFGIDESSSVILRASPGPALIIDLLALMRSESQVMLLDHRLTENVVNNVGWRVGATHEITTVTSLPPTCGYVLTESEIHPLAAGSRRSDDAILQVSSGTTAEPKIIRRSVAEIAAETARYRAFPGVIGPGESIIVASSIVHTWGLFGGVLLGLAQQSEVVLPDRQTAIGLQQAIAAGTRGATLLGVPLHVAMLRKTPAPQQLRAVFSAGAPLDLAAAQPWEHVQVGQTYGMTEVGVIAADLLGQYEGRTQLAPDLRARMIETGELLLGLGRSPYLDPAADRWENGWFETRDAVAGLEDDRLVRLLGRLDGLTSLGGRKVHTSEIEAHLKQTGVVEDAVVFVRDATVEAFVTLATPNTDIDAISRALPEYMRPHRTTVLDELPRTLTGKTLRRRDAYEYKHG
ncbi:AMP-binding protein [Rathayibacter toxicus]|uniref:AMP-dependent synthetase/ligase domain-containing protein n=1 Tax=Rathayibacter toxicus TaxID=145458 RepID=A0A0C5BAA4_9MICO|nr:AMP-binding protein [Rathayibacter toxicus]AJM77823.1 hypothetical protein TI83_07420 [Rathayibacter toxicus]ALS57994.1 hypothetical protein APU90_09660 [Rathayibacter toxicus]KKM44296.1 hypothetical protein VT73_10365 [Rathayibacter toxicus]QOD09042.1 AMP-binding protein [Rathayibacter toxicus]QOD11163.1 AMP-binding protein [Rathayibacter toxicus]